MASQCDIAWWFYREKKIAEWFFILKVFRGLALLTLIELHCFFAAIKDISWNPAKKSGEVSVQEHEIDF